MDEGKLTEQEKGRNDPKGDSKGERRSGDFLYCLFDIYIHTMWGFDYYRLRGVSMADEYIRKADAVNIAESYEVKRDGFHLNDYEYGRNQVADSIASDLEDMPPADVASVVRCKDCKSRRIDGYCTKFQNNISGIAVSWFMPEDDGFCSYGERKGE